ncbi:MAG: hypothetical protein IBX62_02065 [Coriobacteriia bacterium]|nr:hypothetical protein [Coriobacteriia bacterium]
MPSIGGYVVNGPAAPRPAVAAGLLDGLVSLAVTMLAWPFPVMRAAVPVPAHAVALLATLMLVDMTYRGLAARLWGRTLLMYVYDLALSGPERPFPPSISLAWGLGWTVAYVPGLLGARGLLHPDTGLPARLSGLITVAAR